MPSAINNNATEDPGTRWLCIHDLSKSLRECVRKPIYVLLIGLLTCIHGVVSGDTVYSSSSWFISDWVLGLTHDKSASNDFLQQYKENLLSYSKWALGLELIPGSRQLARKSASAIIVQHRIIWSWYTGCWWVGCYTWYSEEGTGRGRSPPRPLLVVPKCNSPPINGQCTNHHNAA